MLAHSAYSSSAGHGDRVRRLQDLLNVSESAVPVLRGSVLPVSPVRPPVRARIAASKYRADHVHSCLARGGYPKKSQSTEQKCEPSRPNGGRFLQLRLELRAHAQSLAEGDERLCSA